MVFSEQSSISGEIDVYQVIFLSKFKPKLFSLTFVPVVFKFEFEEFIAAPASDFLDLSCFGACSDSFMNGRAK